MPHSESIKRPLYQALAAIAGLLLLLVWLEGGFAGKVAPGNALADAAPASGPTVLAKRLDIDAIRVWPATVSARTVAHIAAKVPARISAITVVAGAAVQAGQIVARLDERELQARLSQARAALAAAQARAVSSGADARRAHNLFAQEAATRQMLDNAEAAARAAAAERAEADAALAAAESIAGEGVIRAPFDGVVIKRLLEPGDMALPGQPLLALQSAQRLRVEAAIPESCATLLQPGQALQALIGATRYPATVEEIAPAVDAATRTVLVKAALDTAAGVLPGAFAQLEQPCGRRI